MAAVNSREGVIIMTNGDTHSPQADAFIYAIIVDDATGSGTVTLQKVNGSGPTVFSYTGNGSAPETKWFGIDGCVTTGRGLYLAASSCTVYIYVR